MRIALRSTSWWVGSGDTDRGDGFLPGGVLQLKVVVTVSPPQVERPAAWCGKIDDGGPRTPSYGASRPLARTGPGGLDPQRCSGSRMSPGHPEDLVVPIGSRWCRQRIVSSPQNRDDVAPVAKHIWHRLCRRVEPSPCPRREGARREVGRTRRAGRGSRRRASRGTAFMSGGRVRRRRPARGAPCQG